MTEPAQTPSADPTPLVLLHGVGQAPMAWEDVVVALYGSRRLLTPWVPGLKPTEKRHVELPEAAATLDQQLMFEGFRAVDVVGLSYGALAAMQLAADFPERVRRLVLVSATVNPPKMVMKMQKAALKMTPASRFADSGVSKERLLAAIDAAMESSFEEIFPRITAPTLVVVGGKDKMNQPGSRMLADQLPEARLRVLDGVGHLVNQEAPGQLVEVLQDFLDR